ncbi:hypothetical protein LXA43DRAFT_7229 [Ganoderma leucocontextum]|nr:hypothetical protein LXA43DRAFT_7229 [Ganoderma leucocontextum]
MPQAGSTLLCTPRTGEPQGTSQYYEFPSTTKDCKGAAAAASHADLHHNSNMVSGKLPNLNHVMTPEVVGAGPRPSLSSPTNYILGAMSGPQHHGDGSSTRRELEQLIHPLPQRPMPYRHKPPADSIEMKRREICRNFLANRCKRGDTCHRKHILEGDDIRNVSASFPTNLGHVVPTTIPISPPPANTAMPMASPMIASSIRIVDGLYTDRFSRQHALGLDGPSTALPSLPPINKQSEELLHGPLSHAHLVASPSQSLQDEGRHDPLLALRQASPLPPSPQLQLPPPPSTRPLSSTTDGGAVCSSSVRYPARAMEEDTRPSRVRTSNRTPFSVDFHTNSSQRSNEVCRLYQTGQCPYGDCCFRTHTLALPIQVTALASASGMGKVKKPAPAPLPTHIGGVELCKLNLAGKCPRGDSCHYSHDFELPPSPEPSKTMETAPGMAVPAQDAGPSTEKPSSPPPPARLPPAAAHPPASEPPRKVYVKLPGDVCRMYFFKRQCAWPSCRYRHCSPEEMQAIRELSHAMAEAEKEVAVAVDLPVPAEQDDPVPEEADDEHEGEHLRPSEHASVEEDGSVGESSSRPSNTSKKRIKSRKKGKDREAVDELVHDDGKDKAVVVKEDTKVAEGVKLKEDKGKAKAKDGVNNEKKNVKEKNRATRDQNADEGCKPSSGSKTPGASVKDGKGKEKDEKSTDKEKSKEKEKSEKEKEKSKEKEPGRGRAKGRSSVEVAAPRTEPSALQSSPSLVGSNTPEKSRITPQLPIVGPLPSSQRASAPHAKAAGTSKHTTGLQMQELPDDGGDTDVEESDSSYYTPGSGTVSAQTSWSSMDGRSSVSTVKVAYCFDFIRGNCRRQYCRFSHDVPNSFLGSARVRGRHSTELDVC